ncbi:MAG: TonB-dependent receptor [Bacteroidales bacterium]|nr:TonB-dependent receptor [Bacteroidales bacterium]
MRRILFIFIFIAPIFKLLGQDGSIEGRVHDELNNDPIEFANIIITGSNNGTVSNEKGYFKIENVKSGFVSVTVSYIGFETTTSRDVKIINGKTVFVDIPVKRSDIELGEVTVKVSPFKKTDESPLSLKTVGLSEIENSAGSNRDISKVIQSFPGVTSVSSFRNDLIIRGGGPSENSYYLDGVEIPTINHFSTQGASGGPVGIINADFIGSVNIFTGAFPANTSDALSGVIQLTQIEGNKDKLKLRATLGASEISGTIDGPIGKTGSYILSVRRSYLQTLFSLIGLPFLPTFNDYQFKYKTRINSKNEFTLISIGALDQFKLNTGIEEPNDFQEYVLTNIAVNEQWSYAIGGIWKHFAEKGFHTFILSRNMLNNNYYKYPNNDESQPKNLDFLSQEIENKFRWEYLTRVKSYKINYGVNAEWVKYSNDTYQKFFANGKVDEYSYNSSFNLLKYGLYTQITKKYFSERLTVSAGVRFDGNTYSAAMQNPLNQISPRLSLSYALLPKVSLNANVGRYAQMPSYTTLGFKDNNDVYINKENNISYIKANHFVGGIEYNPSKTMIFTLEGFYKFYEQYPVGVKDSISLTTQGADYGVFGDEAVMSVGTGRAYGIEFMNRIQTDNGFFSIISYTYSHSIFDSEKYNQIPTSWDSRHLLTTSLTKDINKKWQIGAKWRFVGGLPYTPFDIEKSAVKAVFDANNGPVYDLSRLNSERREAFHQLDLRVDRRFNFKKWSFAIYIDIQNVYNSKSTSQIIVREKDDFGNYITTDNGEKYKLRVLDSEDGTLLPTLGIMIEL